MRKKQGGYYGTVYIRTWWSYCKRNSNHSIIDIIMTVILAVGNMDAYEISKIIGG